jgi:hypothetical protein
MPLEIFTGASDVHIGNLPVNAGVIVNGNVYWPAEVVHKISLDRTWNEICMVAEN